MLNPNNESKAPLVFESAGKVFRPDACEALKEAAKQGEVEVSGWARGKYPGIKIPGSILPGIRSIGTWDAQKKQGWSLGEHCNEGLEITYLSRGSLSFSSSGHTTLLRPTDMTVTAPWLVHEVGLPVVETSRLAWVILDVGVRRPNENWIWPDWIILSPSEKSALSNTIQNGDRAVWPGGYLSSTFESIISLLETGQPDINETDAKILINTLMLELSRNIGKGNHPKRSRNRSQETVRLFLARLHEHVEFPWPVQEMADQCGVSRGTFIASCREILNQTPHAYLMQLRLQRACSMLETDHGLSLTDIAMKLGFSSSAHFSSAFRKEFGMAPSEFRQEKSKSLLAAE